MKVSITRTLPSSLPSPCPTSTTRLFWQFFFSILFCFQWEAIVIVCAILLDENREKKNKTRKKNFNLQFLIVEKIFKPSVDRKPRSLKKIDLVCFDIEIRRRRRRRGRRGRRISLMKEWWFQLRWNFWSEWSEKK